MAGFILLFYKIIVLFNEYFNSKVYAAANCK